MSVNLEWDVVHRLVTPYGSLPINTPGPVLSSGLYPLFLVQPPSESGSAYTIVPTIRATRDNISQADGSSIQPPYLSGLVASMTLQYQTSEYGDPDNTPSPACGEDLREMDELLTLHLNALRACSSDPSSLQQLVWTPTGLGGDRMLTWVFLAAWMEPDFTNSPLVATAFQLATPYPYAVDATPTVTAISDGSSASISNDGNIADDPVIVVGASTGFTITNEATGETIVYDSARPGAVAIAGSDTATIDCFLGTITLNDGTDLVAGLDPTQTDFFTLAPGSTTVAATGASISIYSHNPVA